MGGFWNHPATIETWKPAKGSPTGSDNDVVLALLQGRAHSGVISQLPIVRDCLDLSQALQNEINSRHLVKYFY